MQKTTLACFCLLLAGKIFSQVQTEAIQVKGNSTVIYTGDVTPSTSDGTNFGSTATCFQKTQIFEISAVDLTPGVYTSVMSTSLSGTDASEFAIFGGITSPITFSSQTPVPFYFDVRFRPTSAGVKNATVTVGYQRGFPYSGPTYYYTFAITGTATAGTSTMITSTTPGARCGSGTVSLSATANQGTLYWYGNSDGSNYLGSGTSFTTPSISTTKTYYVQAVSGYCASSMSAVTATINNVIPADDPADVTACDTYVLPTLTSGTYYTGSGGTGAILSAGTSISSSQTLYVYSESGTIPNCTSENSFVVTINTVTPVINSTTDASSCAAASLSLSANASSGTISWFDAASGGALLATGSTYVTPVISSNTSYYVSAANGACSSARVPVVAAIGNCTQLNVSSCNRTMTSITELIECTSVAGASAYRFELINGANTLTYVSSTTQLPVNLVSGLKYATTYSVRVAAQVGGIWSAYGSACNLKTPNTKLLDLHCGSTLTNMTDVLTCYEVQAATSYRFEVSLGTTIYTVTSATPSFQMSSISALKYYTTYKVRVASLVSGVWSAYGADCFVTTPLTRLLPAHCGTTVSNFNQTISCFAVNLATQYRFQFTEGSTVLTYVSSTASFKFKNVPGILSGKTYSILVASYAGGVWSAYGQACLVSTAAAMIIQNNGIEAVDESANADEKAVLESYPNPTRGQFTLKTNQEAEFSIFNELGQLVKRVMLTEESNFQTQVDDLEYGIYFITGIVNSERIIKKITVTKF